jgi:hypothetical protein
MHNPSMHQRPAPSGALAEMLAKDGGLDDILEGRGLRFDNPPPPVVPPPAPFVIPPPPWSDFTGPSSSRTPSLPN